jgi:hypothetical protein
VQVDPEQRGGQRSVARDGLDDLLERDQIRPVLVRVLHHGPDRDVDDDSRLIPAVLVGMGAK